MSQTQISNTNNVKLNDKGENAATKIMCSEVLQIKETKVIFK